MNRKNSNNLLLQQKRLNKIGFLCCFLPIFFSMVFVVGIYVLKNSIVSHFASYEFCNNQDILEIFFWIIPKVSFHCELIKSGSLQEYSGAGIAIIIDLFILFFFFLYSIILLVYFRVCTKKKYRTAITHRIGKMNWTSNRLTLFSLGAIGIAAYSVYHTFFFSDLVSDESAGVSRMFAMFSSPIGIGAALHVLISAAGPFFTLSLALISRVHSTRRC